MTSFPRIILEKGVKLTIDVCVASIKDRYRTACVLDGLIGVRTELSLVSTNICIIRRKIIDMGGTNYRSHHRTHHKAQQ